MLWTGKEEMAQSQQWQALGHIMLLQDYQPDLLIMSAFHLHEQTKHHQSKNQTILMETRMYTTESTAITQVCDQKENRIEKNNTRLKMNINISLD